MKFELRFAEGPIVATDYMLAVCSKLQYACIGVEEIFAILRPGKWDTVSDYCVKYFVDFHRFRIFRKISSGDISSLLKGIWDTCLVSSRDMG